MVTVWQAPMIGTMDASARSAAGTLPSEAVPTPETTPSAEVRPARVVVVGARMALLMLLVAGVAMVMLGLLTLARSDPTQVDGWLREVFGHVFGVMAIVVGAAIGVPAATGMWAMAGARQTGAVPAVQPALRRVAAGLGVTAVLAVLGVLVVRGNGLSIPDLGLVGLVGLLSFGLAGAVDVSPHRGRAFVAAIALGLVLLWSVRLLGAAPGIAAG